jgi:hypothetical protein
MIIALVISATAPFSFAETYSCRADVFMPDGYSDTTKVWSPDHKNYVLLSTKPEHAESDEAPHTVSIYAGASLLRVFTLEDLSGATFVKWSSDSKGVYVMWSNGGATGLYEVRVFILEENRAAESGAPLAVALDFEKQHYCQARGNNLYAVRWVKGSAELEMRPEVYPTGDCEPDGGLSADYLVETATGKILRRGVVKEMATFADDCPSDIFPTALTTQKQIDDYRKSNNHDLPEH